MSVPVILLTLQCYKRNRHMQTVRYMCPCVVSAVRYAAVATPGELSIYKPADSITQLLPETRRATKLLGGARKVAD